MEHFFHGLLHAARNRMTERYKRVFGVHILRREVFFTVRKQPSCKRAFTVIDKSSKLVRLSPFGASSSWNSGLKMYYVILLLASRGSAQNVVWMKNVKIFFYPSDKKNFSVRCRLCEKFAIRFYLIYAYSMNFLFFETSANSILRNKK